jgi:DNA-directed RNA polymerase specialized sigma subunit
MPTNDLTCQQVPASPLVIIEGNGLMENLLKALRAKMRRCDYRIVSLRTFQGLSQRKIAKRVGKSRAWVRKVLAKAKRILLSIGAGPKFQACRP